MSRLTLALALFATVAPAAFAVGEITVTKPQDGDFLGRTNTVGYNIAGARREVRVIVKAFQVLAGGREQLAIQVEKRSTPNSNGQINENIDLNFAESTPEGTYRIRVSATESGNTYNTPDPINVTVDVRSPTFQSVNPIDGAFVKGNTNGIVRILAALDEANVDQWRVQINSGDIPNNSGSSQTVNVNWDTKAIINDGQQQITIKIDDKAKNTTTKNVNVTLDRVRPSSNIVTPSPSTRLFPNTNLPVLVDISDQFANSVDITGIDVVARRLNGGFLARVARRTVNNNGNILSWVGRLRWRSSLPDDFKIVVTAIDRAGNRAVIQEVRVKVSR